MMNPSDYRRFELKELAESISVEYFPNELFVPEIVATDNRISYSYGNYEDAFDGLLEHRFGKFHIYLNVDRVERNHPRMRYTFSHELAHYFIDEHRNALKSGSVPSHPSFNSLRSKNVVEREADYFASCLLMPSKKLRNFCLKKPLSGMLIEKIANQFNVSLSAAIFRYYDLSLFPIMIVLSKKGKIEWKMQTDDFKYKYLQSKETVPPLTAAGEYFLNNKTYKTEEIVFADEWFSDYGRVKNEQFYEKCYYLSTDKVLSVIWKKER